MSSRPRIGISACFFHADPNRPIFTGKTLQYVEQSIVHWVQSAGALAVVIPSPEGPTRRGDVTLADYAGLLDVLQRLAGEDRALRVGVEEARRDADAGPRTHRAFRAPVRRSG
jgi:putative glutamine amidotransferase